MVTRGLKLAVSGKGGVGKTTVAAALIKLFAAAVDTVYAVDADPDASLAAAVGIPEEVARGIRPIIELREVILERCGGEGAFFHLNPQVDDVLETYGHRLGNILFLRMGGVKGGGTSCYCRENAFLHAVVSSLLLGRNDVVVMDMGAGIEHLSRGTARGVDVMLVVVEPSRASLNTAALVRKLAGDLGIRRTGIIGNKIRTDREREFVASGFAPEEILGFVRFDPLLWEGAMAGGRVEDTAAFADLREVYRRIRQVMALQPVN